MEIKGQIFVGFDEKPYIHIYRDGYGVMDSIRFSLSDNDKVGISSSSRKVWREWVNEAYQSSSRTARKKT